MKMRVLATALAVAVLPLAANAAVLTFDDVAGTDTGSNPALQQDYHGFDNSNFYVLDPTKYPFWNDDAAHSAPNIAQNGNNVAASLFRTDAFDFVSAWFANGFEADIAGAGVITMTVNGRDVVGGAVTHTASFTLSDTPTLHSFDWSGVRQLDFSSTGRGYSHFSMDDVSYSVGGSDAPEPAAWALMITGFGLAGGAFRRRRAIAA